MSVTVPVRLLTVAEWDELNRLAREIRELQARSRELLRIERERRVQFDSLPVDWEGQGDHVDEDELMREAAAQREEPARALVLDGATGPVPLGLSRDFARVFDVEGGE